MGYLINDGDAEVYALNGPITHGPFSHPTMRKIFEKFGRYAFQRASACMAFNDFLDQIKAGGKRALEIGTYHGVTAVLLAERFDEVISVSIDDDLSRLLKHQICKHLGVTNIRFYDCSDNEEKKRIIDHHKFDFAYSDGDHDNDTLRDWDLVKRCGRVLFHEAWPLQAPVWNLLETLPKDEVTWAQHDCLAYWEGKQNA